MLIIFLSLQSFYFKKSTGKERSTFLSHQLFYSHCNIPQAKEPQWGFLDQQLHNFPSPCPFLLQLPIKILICYNFSTEVCKVLVSPPFLLLGFNSWEIAMVSFFFFFFLKIRTDWCAVSELALLVLTWVRAKMNLLLFSAWSLGGRHRICLQVDSTDVQAFKHTLFWNDIMLLSTCKMAFSPSSVSHVEVEIEH